MVIGVSLSWIRSAAVTLAKNKHSVNASDLGGSGLGLASSRSTALCCSFLVSALARDQDCPATQTRPGLRRITREPDPDFATFGRTRQLVTGRGQPGGDQLLGLLVELGLGGATGC
jgi:hypothetical protein